MIAIVIGLVLAVLWLCVGMVVFGWRIRELEAFQHTTYQAIFRHLESHQQGKDQFWPPTGKT